MKAKSYTDLARKLKVSTSLVHRLIKVDGLARSEDGTFDVDAAKRLLEIRQARKKGEGLAIDPEVIRWRKLYEEFRAKSKKLEFQLASQRAKFSDEANEKLKGHVKTIVWLLQKQLPRRIADALGYTTSEQAWKIYNTCQAVIVEGLKFVSEGNFDPDNFCCGGHDEKGREKKSKTTV